MLEKKGYLSHKTYGKTNVYYAIISKKEYAHHVAKEAFTGLFNGSLNQMVSSFVRNKDISIIELEELRHVITSYSIHYTKLYDKRRKGDVRLET